ncbi:flagellar motor switch protein FliG [Pelotomaculum terephthalicicum JT]|uniref:flagellar motor switch protein FliG n=1 Tax=Pelotomaculum TaxID=191373 RepID=UPI0009CE75D9|nr:MULTISPECIES: flagellar motor switch protein FliG [Pelotomaculum]MCG9967981.1 flagellar motor switch protein FliG [Pelotomaculum terephthalicicum JT]OPX88581.1 MAG: Flagellar motor switch protein FliG [Pelotomaculum sp. PtaB.Bin117]OPY63046.1 MAG: Flagellar motor switch protein FliG [Pelotomaculum sp. PtaU1.Bin065]
MQLSKLTGIQKAAILLIALGSDLSAKVLKQRFADAEIEQLTQEISNMIKVPPEIKYAVFDEFFELHRAREFLIHGGMGYAKELLEKTLGAQKASEILSKLTKEMKAVPFNALRKADPKSILNIIREEHPQTVALILAHLTPEQAGVILASMPPDMQSDIARRVAIIDRLTPDVIKDVEAVLERKISSVVQQDHSIVGGIQSLVDILNRVGRSAEKVVLEGLEREDPALAEEVKRRMLVFEDIIMLPDNFIQRVLREVNSKDLAMAMRGAGEDVNTRIYKNLSKRAAEMLKEEIEFMGPVRLREVEQAQQKIVNILRKLDESGEIIISRGGEDVLV